MAELRAPAGKRENAMKTYHILFNPHAGNGHGEEEAHRLDAMLEGAALVYHNMTQIADYEDFFRTIQADEDVVLCGGDGTLNRFINDTAGVGIPNEHSTHPARSSPFSPYAQRQGAGYSS